MRSHLAKFQVAQPTARDQLDAMRRAAYHQQGIITVRQTDVMDDWLRQGLEN